MWVSVSASGWSADVPVSLPVLYRAELWVLLKEKLLQGMLGTGTVHS